MFMYRRKRQILLPPILVTTLRELDGKKKFSKICKREIGTRKTADMRDAENSGKRGPPASPVVRQAGDSAERIAPPTARIYGHRYRRLLRTVNDNVVKSATYRRPWIGWTWDWKVLLSLKGGKPREPVIPSSRSKVPPPQPPCTSHSQLSA
ncbi:unnamed protein product [Nesidiocoris tenuis]|uniref:Uncharacterized protein n=1 Tax=Nesidiocoris tenuis TaxID=355587 RepID=A0A6H5G117_9HEMI|nr:unnamed protein product [Nesidiocoris tenuis]